LGPSGSETKIALHDSSGLRSEFLNETFVNKNLGPMAESLIVQANDTIREKQQQLIVEKC